jgi:hypothetical protein
MWISYDLRDLLSMPGDELSWMQWRWRRHKLLMCLRMRKMLSQRTRIRGVILLAMGMRYHRRRMVKMMVMCMPTQPQCPLRKLYERHSRCWGRRRRYLVRPSCHRMTTSTDDVCPSISHNLRQTLNLLLKRMHLLPQRILHNLNLVTQSTPIPSRNNVPLQPTQNTRHAQSSTPEEHPQIPQLG